ncbi:raffinose/stachyose/melibiose transport system substrate-binding protein [Lachnospiraceae bacterium PF1-22]|uniref:ABC transporter substrate-binding protein n=1 Tax=Ohessyouella blattaphilus TaxID=2949333 RepID=UPI003E311463
MKKTKKFLSVLLATSLVLLMLVGCSSGDNANEEGEEGSAKGKKITFMCWYDEDDMEGILGAINNELGGEYEVEYTYVALTDYNNVLSTQLAAGEGPDIVADGTNFPARIKAGNVKDITDADYLDVFNEAGFSLCQDGDTVYGVPSYGWFSGIWYNKDILAEAGVSEPTTLDEFISACEKIAAIDKLPLGLGLADGDTANHSLLGYMENSFYHNNDKNTLGTDFDTEFANGEVTLVGNYEETAAEWYALIEKGYINPEMLGISNEEALNNFITGNSAFFYGGPWQYSSLAESDINFGMLPHLSKTGKDVYMLGGAAVNFGINVNTKNEEGAEKVLEVLASVAVQQAFVDANPGGFSYCEGVNAEMPAEYENVKEVINSGNISCPWDRWGINMAAQSLIDESVSQVQGLVSGDITLEQYVEAMDLKADSIRYE